MTTVSGTAPATHPAGCSVRCIVCNRLVPAGHIDDCPVCHANNTDWNSLTWLDRLRQFPVAAWAISLLIIIVWLYVRGIVQRAIYGAEKTWPALGIAAAVASILALLFMFGVFFLRFWLRHYELLRPLRQQVRKPSLASLAMFCIIAAVIIGMALIAIIQWLDDHQGYSGSTNALKTSFAVLYSLESPILVLGMMLLGAKRFTQNLARRFPIPIYADTERLRELVLPTVDDYLARLRRRLVHAQPVSMCRNRQGGFEMVVRQEVEVEKKTQSGDVEFVPKGLTFKVVTNEWGYILSLEEQKPRRKSIP